MALPPLPLPGQPSQVHEFGLQHDRFKLVRKIANGGQGEVYECSRLNTGEDFAVKIIDRRALEVSDRNEVFLRREIRTLRELQHRNVVTLHDAFWEDGSCFIVMDMSKEGDLREKITMHVGLGSDPVSSEQASRFVARQLVNGIGYMHQRRVIHRDLKVENILTTKSRPATPPLACRLYDVQISDFGLSTWLDIVGEEMTPCGTPAYLAPEVLKDNYDERVDYWSFGVIIFVTLCGDFPFDAIRNPVDACMLDSSHIKVTSAYDLVSEQAKEFVTGLLVSSPDRRLIHQDCLRHSWLASETPSTAWLEDIDSSEPPAADIGSPASPVSLAGAVAQVNGWTGAALDSVTLHCRDGSVQSHGGDGGWSPLKYTLEPDEIIIAVAQETRIGTDEHLGNALTLFTSSCNLLEFQGNNARRRHRFIAPLGRQIVGLHFNDHDLAGIHMEPVPEPGAAGSVEEISGRCGYSVDQIVFRFRSGQELRYGGSGGFEQEPFKVEAGEYIVAVEQARRDGYLGNSVVFYTSNGNVYKLSGMEASLSRRFAVSVGRQICGLEFEGNLLTAVRTCPQQFSCPQPGDVSRHAVS